MAPILLFVAVWLGSSGSVVAALLAPVVPGGWWTLAAVGALPAIPLTILTRGLEGRSYPSARARLFAVRPFWYAMLFLPMLAASGLAGLLIGLPFAAPVAVARWSMGVAAIGLTVLGVVGLVGSRRLLVRQLRVGIPGLPAPFEGLRIVQLSDLHVGPHTSRRFLGRVVSAVVAEHPDLVAFTGDQVDDFARDVEPFVAAFGALSAPLGVYAIAGNHDVIAGWGAVERGLASAGMSVLVNEAVPIERGGSRIWLAGTGDPMARGWRRDSGRDAAPDVAATLRPVPAGEPVVALAHNPVLWPELARHGVELTLSGHTHYGQLAIPRLGWSAASPFLDLAMGMHQRGRSSLYINPGTNYWGLPFRIGTAPEVTVVTLTRRQDGCAPALGWDGGVPAAVLWRNPAPGVGDSPLTTWPAVS
ncbi:MAG: metallophosphoesterase [Gemmatimonadota bacterium]